MGTKQSSFLIMCYIVSMKMSYIIEQKRERRRAYSNQPLALVSIVLHDLMFYICNENDSHIRVEERMKMTLVTNHLPQSLLYSMIRSSIVVMKTNHILEQRERIPPSSNQLLALVSILLHDLMFYGCNDKESHTRVEERRR